MGITEFADLKIKETDRLVSETVTDLVGSVRENLVLNKGYRLNNSGGLVGHYLHNRVSDNCGLRGSLVSVSCEGQTEETAPQLQTFTKELAVHVVANTPQPSYLKIEDVPESVVEKEKELLREQLVNAGSKPELLEKIISGKMKK